MFVLRFQLLHHGFCFVEARPSLLHLKLLYEINQHHNHHHSSLLGPMLKKKEEIMCSAIYRYVGEVFLRSNVNVHWRCRCGYQDAASCTLEHFNLCHVVMFLQSWKKYIVQALLVSHRKCWNKPVCILSFKRYLPWAAPSSIARLHCWLLYSMTSCGHK